MSRHQVRGTEIIYWVPAGGIADVDAPTAAEVLAGTNLTGAVRQLTGFRLESAMAVLTTPDSYDGVLSADLGKRLTVQPALLIYNETDSEPFRTTLAASTQGYVVLCREGAPTATEKVAVWPVISGGPEDRHVVENEAATFRVGFSVWDKPREEVALA